MCHYPLNLDLEVWCSNIQTKLKKKWNSTKNQSFFMGSGGFFEVKVAWKYKFLTPVLFFFVFLLELGDWLECCFAVFAIPPGDLSSSSSIVSNTSSRSLDESSSSMESPRFFERCQSRKIKIWKLLYWKSDDKGLPHLPLPLLTLNSNIWACPIR